MDNRADKLALMKIYLNNTAGEARFSESGPRQ